MEDKECRIGKTNINNQGCLMKIIEYNGYHDTIIEFQDKYNYIAHTQYGHFIDGSVKNPYCPTVCGIGIIGSKYPSRINKTKTKEYETWTGIIKRCFDENRKQKNKNSTYKNVICCNEWLLFDNFYEWLHKQLNFDKWYNGDKWAIDKDIIVKGNKIYSPETCCLVPMNVNNLFTRSNAIRGDLPIGVSLHKGKYVARCSDNKGGSICIGRYSTPNEAYEKYKECKENIIKQVAQDEYDKGNIIKSCYEAMMKYEVEITD